MPMPLSLQAKTHNLCLTICDGFLREPLRGGIALDFRFAKSWLFRGRSAISRLDADRKTAGAGKPQLGAPQKASDDHGQWTRLPKTELGQS